MSSMFIIIFSLKLIDIIVFPSLVMSAENKPFQGFLSMQCLLVNVHVNVDLLRVSLMLAAFPVDGLTVSQKQIFVYLQLAIL